MLNRDGLEAKMGKKYISRAVIRGERLSKECLFAKTTSGEYGPKDNRIFCYGLYAKQSETDTREECWKCKAFIENAEPLNEDAKNDLP